MELKTKAQREPYSLVPNSWLKLSWQPGQPEGQILELVVVSNSAQMFGLSSHRHINITLRLNYEFCYVLRDTGCLFLIWFDWKSTWSWVNKKRTFTLWIYVACIFTIYNKCKIKLTVTVKGSGSHYIQLYIKFDCIWCLIWVKWWSGQWVIK